MGAPSYIRRYYDTLLDPDVQIMRRLGSNVLAMTFPPEMITSVTNPVDQRIHIGRIFVSRPMLATGLALYFSSNGNYTANFNNKVALYRYDRITPGNYIRVAQSANTPTLFSAGSLIHGADFTAQVALTPENLYFGAFLYCRSAEVTPPGLGVRAPGVGVGIATMNYPSQGKSWATLSAKTDMLLSLPTTDIGAGALAATSSMPWMAVY